MDDSHLAHGSAGSSLRRAAVGVVLAIAVAACGGSSLVDFDTEVTLEPAAESPGSAAAASPAAVTGDPAETTSTTVFERLIDLDVAPPPWETVTIPTPDGLTLSGRFWTGNDTVVMVQHDFDVPQLVASGQRQPNSSENVLLWSGIFAGAGYTVLSFDFRGHGASEGEAQVRESPIDLKAAQDWLLEEGYEDVILVGWLASATAAVVLDAADDEVDYAGIAFVFSPPQETGMDAYRAIPLVDTPMWFVGSTAGQTASWAKRLESKALDSYGVHTFERTPNGLQFMDVFGPELTGRLLDFVDAAAAAA
jgi:alpha/beta superfamily hydrolase